MLSNSFEMQFDNNNEDVHEQTNSLRKRDVSDSVYGQINLPEICWLIIDTVQFQRLRNIKQLSICDLVYPSGEHSRKQHCMGVAYLAGLALKTLITNHEEDGPKLNVTKNEELMVQIAGLCHDLGHGPFSHTFDAHFMPLKKPNTKHCHEKWSILMFERLLEENPHVQQAFDNLGFTKNDIVFIKEALSGIPMGTNKNWPFNGRGPEKAFLYELISNKRCGVDVDRFDYFKRDAKYLNIKTAFDSQRLFQNMRVMEYRDENGCYQNVLAFRDKAQCEIAHMGATRAHLHERAYQHKTNKVIQIMLVDALLLVDDFLLYEGRNGNILPLSETANDMVAFEQVDDHVVRDIKRLPNNLHPNVVLAKQLLKDIDTRKFYKLVGEQEIRSYFLLNGDEAFKTLLKIIQSANEVIEDMCSFWPDVLESENRAFVIFTADELTKLKSISVNDFKKFLAVSVSDINHGMQYDAPASKCLYFTKNDFSTAKTYQQINSITINEPKSFRLHKVSVYCREREDQVIFRATKLCYSKWLEKHKLVEIRNNGLLNLSLNLDVNIVTPPSSPRHNN